MKGLVSVTRDGKTIFKASAMCNGQRTQMLADALNDSEDLSLQAIWDASVRTGFGCEKCLVIQRFDGDMTRVVGDLPKAYALKFIHPRWHPGDRYGWAPYIEVLALDNQHVLTISEDQSVEKRQ